MQNTPKNYLTVADALILVCGSGNDAHEMLHEDILNTLPQLICTAFVPQNDSKPSCGLFGNRGKSHRMACQRTVESDYNKK
jgi:hypothetical protein